ncbi:unnamed protein product [Gongylonema pulchrum]|uniref:TH1 domain-containing protein n=1 Tax=Gongylonema pulchrum TaxID=637853 RepID=A0A3P7R1H2_9BILA|nr:unnamed protein product [Gongylonema pulchrum]
MQILKRQIAYSDITSIGLSPYQDNFLVISVRDSYTSLLETPLKTELVVAVNKRYREVTKGAILPLVFSTTYQIILKKTRFGGGTRSVAFSRDDSGSDVTQLLAKDKTLTVSVGPGLPNCTRPSGVRPAVVKHYERRGGPSAANTQQLQWKIPQLNRQAPLPPQHATAIQSNRIYPRNGDLNVNRNDRVTSGQVINDSNSFLSFYGDQF